MLETVPTLLLLVAIPIADLLSTTETSVTDVLLQLALLATCTGSKNISIVNLCALVFAAFIYALLLLNILVVFYRKESRDRQIPTATTTNTLENNTIHSPLLHPSPAPKYNTYGTLSPHSRSLLSPEGLLFNVEDLLSPYMGIPNPTVADSVKFNFVEDLVSINSEESIEGHLQNQNPPPQTSPLSSAKILDKCLQTTPILATLLALSTPKTANALPITEPNTLHSDIYVPLNSLVLLFINLSQLLHASITNKNAFSYLSTFKCTITCLAWLVASFQTIFCASKEEYLPILFTNCYFLAFQTSIVLLSCIISLSKLLSRYRLQKSNDLFTERLNSFNTEH